MTARFSSPTTRSPAEGASTGAGTRRQARTCSCRCCSWTCRAPRALTQRVGLAALDAARAVLPGADVTLKWPNDLLLDGRKLAGILAQRSASTGAIVVGLGLNVGWAPDGAARLGEGIGVAHVLRETLVAFDALGSDVAERYRLDLATLGSDVRVDLPDGSVLDGRATGVDDDGRLIVAANDGSIQHLDVGDVVHARHAD